MLTDKEYIELQGKIRASTNSNVDDALMYAEKMEKSNNDMHKAFAIGAKSYFFQMKGDSVKSKKYYNTAFDFLKKMKPSIEKTKLNAYLLNYGGLAEWKRRNLNNALKLYNQGKQMSQNAGDLIQVIKFNNNISSIYGDAGNYKLAIALAKQSDKLTDENAYLYDKEKYNQSKTIVNYKLGSFYESEFYQKEKKPFLLDSAIYYYKQALVYSNESSTYNISAKVNLGKIYTLRNNFNKAEEVYLEVLKSNSHDLTVDDFEFLNANLGELYFKKRKYNEALLCFKKIDSVQSVNPTDDIAFMYSNYYQAKIYNIFNDNKNALIHSAIYLENYQKTESKLTDEASYINSKIARESFYKEMLEIKRSNKKKVFVFQILMIAIGLSFVLLVFVLFWNINQKKKANLKAMQLIEEFKIEIQKNNQKSQNPVTEIIDKNEASSFLSIDEEKENEIIKKLKELEDKQAFLNQDYTQQYVAKRIKTNTSYLSYVVNKRFGKTFSEYANELKINYVINQLITNPTYRKYSTQAIAESAGFKKANSFTASFKKRTGVTPVQFAEKIDADDSV